VSRRIAALLVPALLLGAAGVAAGCTSGREAAARGDTSSPFADCAALGAPPTAAKTTGSPAAPVTGTPDPVRAQAGAVGRSFPLPDLGLPCFTGGDTVSLRSLRGPAVINLWASWCAPCRKELPAFQRFAERAAGRVHVIGVDTRDDRAAAQSLADDLSITFPTLFDPGEKLRLQLERSVLPITLFVDGEGRVAHVYDSTTLDEALLGELVVRHLGVTVQS
jgi:thiol-disulfide isomerase/thioredoxin